MSDYDRLKQRMVGDAIRENVELIAGRRRLPARRRRGRSAVPALAWAAGTLGLAATAAFALVWSGWLPVADASIPQPLSAAPQVATVSVPEPATSAALELGALPVPFLTASGIAAPAMSAAEERRFSAPAPLDPAALPLGVRRIVLDPGHGGINPGTMAGKLLEKEITLDLALRLRPLLEAEGYEVTMTREGDVDLDLAARVALANEQRGDLFLSIHVNWLGNRAARGIETFHLGPTDDPVLTELAGIENAESGYSLTDFRRLLAGIYEGVRHNDSRSLAESVHRSLFQALRVASPGLKDRGVKTAPFVVLIGNEMPAVLVEVGSLSDQQDVELFAGDEYRQTIAEALRDGVLSFATARTRPATRIASAGTTARAGGG
ncbi:MAG TPA: N-acetylmuramoyl-L-alanine amidase [Thermoanaerobaculia bacterium]|nr:N-acetylmuramoyl-L-alanine amidase [Thermoanaerobaculia bacterium]